MAKSGLNPKVDAFVARAKKWQPEIRKLRKILLDSGLSEELRWGKPCYQVENRNVVIIIPFKESCALMFFKGALLKDPKGIMVPNGENSRGPRQIRFTNVREIARAESTLKAYIREAAAVEKAGLKVVFKNTKLKFPQEFQDKLDESRALKTAFEALTPGRQRGYNLYFSGAKQSKTRAARVQKNLKRILSGKGLDD